MATNGFIFGTEGKDLILRDYLSPGVSSDPADLTGTEPGFHNDIIFGYGGDDVIELGYQSDIVDAGTGDDLIDAREGGRPGFYLVLSGGPGNDRILGSDRIDDLDGNYQETVTDPMAGRDVLIGGLGDDRYHIDNYGDRIYERRDEGTDTVFSNLSSYRLKANFEELVVVTPGGTGIGNAADNYLECQAGGALYGGLGNDAMLGFGPAYLDGGRGNDGIFAFLDENVLVGGAGDDVLEVIDAVAEDGTSIRYEDALRGGTGDDFLSGAAGADSLVGGCGFDTFNFYWVTDSTPDAYDVIAPGDGARAFEGAGTRPGDLIVLPYAVGLDTNFEIIPLDFDAYRWGETGKGGIVVVDRGANSVVQVNIDDDSAIEFKVVIKDGSTKASAYTMDDFVDPLVPTTAEPEALIG